MLKSMSYLSSYILNKIKLTTCVGVRNGNPLHCSCLENSMDRGAWWAIVHGLQRVGHKWAHTHTHTQNYVCSSHYILSISWTALVWKISETLMFTFESRILWAHSSRNRDYLKLPKSGGFFVFFVGFFFCFFKVVACKLLLVAWAI